VALRLAQTLEFLAWAWSWSNEPEPARIGIRSVLNALRIIDEWVRPNLERVFSEAALPPAVRDAIEVAGWLLRKKPEQINARDLRRQPGFTGPKEPKDLDAAIEVLVDARWLRQSSRPQQAGVGRPRKDFIVNSAIYRGA
jgi:hypothetical protein